MKQNNQNITLSALSVALGLLVTTSSFAMQPLSETEMSEAQGQALLTLAYTAPNTSNQLLNYGYYKLGLEAEMELNANIKSLQLGCGGINGAGDCDIDMSNVSLTGPADGKIDHQAEIDQLTAITNRTPAQQARLQTITAEHGTPTWSTDRANTSAKLTNPFIEFAIRNPTSAALREIVGFRLSAEKVLGYLSAGVINDKDSTTEKSTGGGINTFSGYLQVSPTAVNSKTERAMFGTRPDQIIHAKITALGQGRTVTTNTNAMTPGATGYEAPPNKRDSWFLTAFNQAGAYVNPATGQKEWGINVPSQTVGFTFPQTAVTGNRMSQLNLVVRDVAIPTIAIGADSGVLQMRMDRSIAGLASDPLFYMGEYGTTAQGCATTYDAAKCSYITNLKVNVTVKQNFNLVHNLPLTSGGYLSLQKEALRWPGSASAYTYNLTNGAIDDVGDDYVATDANLIFNQGDIAQPGWWMSFKDPLDFGALNPTQEIKMDDVLPQIATFITNYLSQNNIALGFSSAVGAGIGAPVHKGIGNIELAPDARAVMVLENLLLDGHQQPISNCWGNLKFC